MTRIACNLPPPLSLELTQAQEEMVEIEKQVRARTLAFTIRLGCIRASANEDPYKSALLKRRATAIYREHHRANLSDLLRLAKDSPVRFIPRLRAFESKDEIESKLHSVTQEQLGITLAHHRIASGMIRRSARLAFELFRTTCSILSKK